jgi:hypothetical protein
MELEPCFYYFTTLLSFQRRGKGPSARAGLVGSDLEVSQRILSGEGACKNIGFQLQCCYDE